MYDDIICLLILRIPVMKIFSYHPVMIFFNIHTNDNSLTDCHYSKFYPPPLPPPQTPSPDMYPANTIGCHCKEIKYGMLKSTKRHPIGCPHGQAIYSDSCGDFVGNFLHYDEIQTHNVGPLLWSQLDTP